jgi:hypothetical protein
MNTFLAGAISGFLICLLVWRIRTKNKTQKLPDNIHIILDADFARLATVFAAVEQTGTTSFWLDFPGTTPEKSCRIYFNNTKKRLEQTIKH